MIKTYGGIDNGVTGSIGILRDGAKPFYCSTPVKLMQDYTKKKQNVNRIVFSDLIEILQQNVPDPEVSFFLLERPFKNPGQFNSTLSAMRAHESTLIAFEFLGIPYAFIDSKEWQKVLLPEGMKGDALKQASFNIALNMFPDAAKNIIKQKDGDGILIAEYCRRKYA